MSAEVLTLISFALIVAMKIVSIVLGYLPIRLGHGRIASGAKGEFKFSAKLSGVTTDPASVSPGLWFVLLGSMLIGVAIFVDKGAKLDKDDRAKTKAIEAPARSQEYPEP